MVVVRQIDPEQQAAFDEWVAGRPPLIQEMIRKLSPDRLYRMKGSSKRCTIDSYEEDGTVTVSITGEFNLCMFDRHVFGIKIDNLEECDLPGPDEKIGAILTDEVDINAYIDHVRSEVLKARGVEPQSEN